jgi:hypothetical protein
MSIRVLIKIQESGVRIQNNYPSPPDKYTQGQAPAPSPKGGEGIVINFSSKP